MIIKPNFSIFLKSFAQKKNLKIRTKILKFVFPINGNNHRNENRARQWQPMKRNGAMHSNECKFPLTR